MVRRGTVNEESWVLYVVSMSGGDRCRGLQVEVQLFWHRRIAVTVAVDFAFAVAVTVELGFADHVALPLTVWRDDILLEDAVLNTARLHFRTSLLQRARV